MSLPVDEDGEEEGDDHDRGPHDRHPCARYERVENNAGNRESCSPFLHKGGEEDDFRSFQNPYEKGIGEEGDNSQVITRDGEEVGDACPAERFLHFVRDVSLLAEDEGLEDPRTGRIAFALKETTDMVPPGLDPKEERISVPLSYLDPSFIHGQECNDANPFEGKLPLVRKPPRVLKASRGAEAAEDS
mgnify:CR=1 FL=1